MSEISKSFHNRGAVILFGVTFFFLTSLSQIAGQTEAGFFSIVNVVNSKTNTIVSVDGKPLRPDGIKPAKVTGGLGFPVGSHRIDATNMNFKPISMSIDLSPSVSP